MFCIKISILSICSENNSSVLENGAFYFLLWLHTVVCGDIWSPLRTIWIVPFLPKPTLENNCSSFIFLKQLYIALGRWLYENHQYQQVLYQMYDLPTSKDPNSSLLYNFQLIPF